MKRVLITGGAGFIGSHLAEKFLNLNYQVVCLDNLITGQKKNIHHLLKKPHFKFANLDVIDEKAYRKAIIKQQSFDLILHFASPAGPNPCAPKSYLKYPIKTYLVNSMATHFLLKLALEKKSAFLFASTSEIYGDPLEHPQKESYFGNVNPVGSRACYDESKRFGEMATMTFSRCHNLNAKIIRIFNTYGPRMNPDDGRVITQFIHQALDNKPLTLYGKGKQTRSFCYIDDLVAGIMTVLQKGKNRSIYNLGGEQEITIAKLAQAVKKSTGSKSKISFKKLPEDDPQQRKPDLSKIKKLGWQPKTKLKAGLQKTINYFKEARCS